MRNNGKKKIDVLVEVKRNPVEPITVWMDNPKRGLVDILSIEGVCKGRINSLGEITIMVDPRYDVIDLADEIRSLLTAKIPDVFRE